MQNDISCSKQQQLIKNPAISKSLLSKHIIENIMNLYHQIVQNIQRNIAILWDQSVSQYIFKISKSLIAKQKIVDLKDLDRWFVEIKYNLKNQVSKATSVLAVNLKEYFSNQQIQNQKHDQCNISIIQLNNLLENIKKQTDDDQVEQKQPIQLENQFLNWQNYNQVNNIDDQNQQNYSWINTKISSLIKYIQNYKTNYIQISQPSQKIYQQNQIEQHTKKPYRKIQITNNQQINYKGIQMETNMEDQNISSQKQIKINFLNQTNHIQSDQNFELDSLKKRKININTRLRQQEEDWQKQQQIFSMFLNMLEGALQI